MHVPTNKFLRGLSVKVPICTYFVLATKGESGKNLVESSAGGWYTRLCKTEEQKELGRQKEKEKRNTKLEYDETRREK